MGIEGLFSMEGRVCLVTGGSRGLGFHMARGFLQAGAARVYITARRAEPCAQAARVLGEYGDCVALPGDVATSAGQTELVQAIASRESHLDVLVNNAGTAWGGAFAEFPERGWDKVMELNVKSPFFLIQKCLPLLKKHATAERTSAVINIGSIAGVIGRGLDAFSYATSKAAVHQVTRILATELASDHVRVNAIAPGRFYSKMTEFISQDEAALSEDLATIPMGRWGQAEDIAGVAVMLASRAGGFITGQIVAVDGGASLVV